MKKTTVNWIALLLALIFGLSLGGCVLRPRPVRRDNNYLFRLGFSGTPDSLNPYLASNDEAAALFALVYDSLFRVDPETGEYKGSLCEDWSVTEAASEGGLLLHLTLRSGVIWQDGEPLTAKDVEFSLQSLKDFSARYGYPDCEALDTTGIYVIDDSNLSMVIWTSENAVLECLSRVPILPRHIWNELDGMQYGSKGVPEDYLDARKTLFGVTIDAKQLTGSGPYIWSGMENGICSLSANPSYWNGAPAAGLVELHFGLTDPGESLSRGAVDACWDMSGAWYEALGERRGTRLTAGTMGELYLLGIHLDPGSSSSRKTLQDPYIRWAMDYCLDRADILNFAFGGGVPARGLLAPSSPWGYEEKLEKLRDLSTASADWLLDSMGYKDRNGDGVRESPEGEKLSFGLLYSDASPAWERAAEMISGALREIGVELTPHACASRELTDAMAKGTYDLCLTATECRQDPFYTLGAFVWDGGDNAFGTDGEGTLSPGWNFSRYQNADYDALFGKMLYAEGTERAEQVARLGQMLYDDAAVLPIGFRASYQACSSAWTGLEAYRGNGLFFTPEILAQQLLTITPGGRR